MKCPICDARIFPGADRCHDCGCHIRTHAAPVSESPAASPVFSRPRRSRARLILTLLALVPVTAIIVFTLLITFSVRSYPEPVIPEPNYSIEVPSDRVTIPLPEASEECFSISKGNVTFLPEQWDSSPIVQVPELVDGQTVTGLAPDCFAGCRDLTTIVLPDTIRRIGAGAFSGCTSLRGLYLPDGTEVLDADAFADCVSLEAVFIPASVRAIAPDCFRDCAGLLYIFYEGPFDDWNALYSDYITPFTAAICLDGTYYHGTGR